jgi:hypothetical protein
VVPAFPEHRRGQCRAGDSSEDGSGPTTRVGQASSVSRPAVGVNDILRFM